MTCIVGLEHEGHIYIGGDSASVSGWDIIQTRLKKVFRMGDFIIGYTSSFRMGQILQYNLDIEKQKDDIDDLRYMATIFIESVRKSFGEGGYREIESERESGGFFLVGYKGKIYSIGDDFQVNSSIDGFTSVGSGESYALGSLFETKGEAPFIRLEKALSAASYFSGAVCPPFTIVSSKDM